MNLQKQIEKHQRAIELLSAAKVMQSRINRSKDYLQGSKGLFPRLVAKYENEIDTRERALTRLKKSYIELIKL